MRPWFIEGPSFFIKSLQWWEFDFKPARGSAASVSDVGLTCHNHRNFERKNLISQVETGKRSDNFSLSVLL